MRISEPVCEDAGYDLVDIRYTQAPDGWLVQVFIDHPEREGEIGFADCERISRELSAVIDVEDPIPHAFRLEVSSPGIDRVLRKPIHFRRHVGEQVKITMVEGTTPQYAGRYRYTGVLVAINGGEGDTIATLDVDGDSYELPVSDIATAKLVPDWDALMGSKSQNARAGRD
jgi:ribosome maturation factor RimP